MDRQAPAISRSIADRSDVGEGGAVSPPDGDRRQAAGDQADLDRLFRLRTTRVLTANGTIRFRHWRLYGARGLAGKQAAVWIHGETLTTERASGSLAQYAVELEPDGHHLRAVGEARISPTAPRGYPGSRQSFLPALEAVEWRPAQRLAPYRARRRRQIAERQPRLLAETSDEQPTGS